MMNRFSKGLSIGLLFFGMAFSPLDAASVEGKYEITFSVLGKIGEADVMLEREQNDYHIHIEGRLTGFAASMGSHRKETYDSYGKVVKGVFVPERYAKVRQSDNRYEKTVYTFNASDQTITKRQTKERLISESHFDVGSMSMVTDKKKKETSSSKILPYYAENDLLSLFFNVRHILKDIPPGSQKVGETIGATHDKGKVLISNPGGKKRALLKKLMPDNEDRLITVVVDQDIFESEKGELYINLDRDYLAKEVMLKDVLLFGDIRAKRTLQRGSLKILTAASLP